ncbi:MULTISPECIES: hypothetical protein [Paenarthrobacter]|uniref:Uncharacterized protein n=1 Tax=Paenarthrobacter ureafaciens TaxID=37931 RepID=A0AAX3EKQ5_PAEUR|nr:MULTISPECIES: hypothetical protein [Paenarthrobacter]NKR12471.1 hypothetical protein [Arthrobacter sp. M5]NKR14302.1 hypothetical protein [Arthrobacter sp. M6]OEH61259.1 hypothetical protein A5N17_14155 [Arthrobacter sp. D2]OEH64310.1 hypothetical protein A5N13_13035 [Arthrobacter sp. D4]MDO5874468.1 hypothetical protein [Paenarthrobacter sp. SD-1]
MVHGVSDLHDGSFRIRTATGSLYLLEMKPKLLTRFAAAVDPTVDHLDIGTSVLRRDGESLHVHKVIRLAVGVPSIFLVQVRTDDPTIPTLRATSRVVEIALLADHYNERRLTQ